MTEHKFNFITEVELLEEIESTGELLTFKEGDIIVQPEKYIKVIPLLIKGTLKVTRVDPNGNEIFLYYITTGQSCAVSLSTCLTNKLSNIKAVAEDKIELIAISAINATKWFNKYPGWRTFVLQTMDSRFEELISTIDTIAFSKTDKRIESYLIARSKALNTNNIQITHQEIANDLSTTREVISRLLKHLEQEGKLTLFRNRIKLNGLMYQ
jgi:CRP/FNR family transcriptional regulator